MERLDKPEPERRLSPEKAELFPPQAIWSRFRSHGTGSRSANTDRSTPLRRGRRPPEERPAITLGGSDGRVEAQQTLARGKRGGPEHLDGAMRGFSA
jgi:hypothetical protein